MTAPRAQAVSRSQRAFLRTLHRWGWVVQGQLGGHFRPLILVTAPPPSWRARLAWKLYWLSLPDRKRIVRMVSSGQAADLQAQLQRVPGNVRWLTCIGVDGARKCISVHRPFHPGPFPERDAAHIFRYLAYFNGPTSTPVPTEAARAAEREGY